MAGTNFQPYTKLLAGLGIPFAVIMDWDYRGDDKDPLGWNRSIRLVETIHSMATGKSAKDLVAELEAFEDMNKFGDRCDEFGVFTNANTLEIDLFSGAFVSPIAETLKEAGFGRDRTALIHKWKTNPSELDHAECIKMIEDIGKGRFAQRLATRVADLAPPGYIQRAIDFVAARV